ncbi:heterokaryon incompatibility protein-domain-containing protein [Rhypophila decipiens]|uniref:Heterokaryon incompatibility protein-domain-containing protein n=1 Tax=Rhypophila decipiens TaxID=261697 RepID=A0AAN6XVV8_9PEZI|nr:heterokaryon incompatibility protein-domain-containing protein [Rhypophila decipiens]
MRLLTNCSSRIERSLSPTPPTSEGTPDSPQLQPPPLLPSEYFPGSAESIPPYAILSHTWDSNSEISFKELENPDKATYSKAGFLKIQKSVRLAVDRDGLDHCWVDTCCIDKSSSAELSEAINSMFRWYARAAICYVYLSDLEPLQRKVQVADLEQCRWFTRGWTLQELVAPGHIVFFDKEWNEVGDKHGLSEQLSAITGVPAELLRRETDVSEYSVAKRLSWASKRQTTRDEDIAYCLLGLFDVNMVLLYGEGRKKAFRRLQRACIEQEGDPSIFCWRSDDETQDYAPILADDPSQFRDCGAVSVMLEDTIYRNMTISPRGITKTVSWIHLPMHQDDGYLCIFDIHCTDDVTGERMGVCVRKIAGGTYCRCKPWMIARLSDESFMKGPFGEDNWTLVEKATLATNDSFYRREVYNSGNPVLGNRHRAMRLIANPDDATDLFLSVYHSRAFPRSHWDVHDKLFFCSARNSKSWSAFFIHGLVHETEHSGVPVNLFVGCHLWNVSRPRMILANLNGLGRDKVTNLQVKLHDLLFENDGEAYATMMLDLDGVARETRRIVRMELGSRVAAKKSIPAYEQGGSHPEARCWGPKVVISSVETAANSFTPWHVRSSDCNGGDESKGSDGNKDAPVRVRVEVELKMEKDASICYNDVVSLYLRVISI